MENFLPSQVRSLGLRSEAVDRRRGVGGMGRPKRGERRSSERPNIRRKCRRHFMVKQSTTSQRYVSK